LANIPHIKKTQLFSTANVKCGSEYFDKM